MNAFFPVVRSRINFSRLGRHVSFVLHCEPNFVPDINMHKFVAETDGIYEPDVTHVLLRALRPGDLAIDGGANIGFLSLTMSRLVGDGGRVVAVEPTPRTFQKLQANIDLNHVRNVEAVNCALWGDNCEVTLHQSMDASTNSLMPTESEIRRTTCPAMTLSKLCGADVPRLIKLDLEGAEVNVLMGSPDLLKRGVDFILCEINRKVITRFSATEDDLIEFMRDHGYLTFILHYDGTVPRAVPRDCRIQTYMESFNVLFSTGEKIREIWQ